MSAHLYTTKYKPATDYKPAMIEVRYDLMTKPVAKLCWQSLMQPYENHRYAVHRYLQDTGQSGRVIATGDCLNGYWFAVEGN